MASFKPSKDGVAGGVWVVLSWGIISLPGVNQDKGEAGGLIKAIWFRRIGVDQGGQV